MIHLRASGFGDFDHPTVIKLVKLTADLLQEVTGIASPRPVSIIHRPGNPMCCNHGQHRLIYLSAEDDFWGQWVYQFAHEFLHHLIDGPMTGELSGLKWFEETLCEAASRYTMWRLSDPGLCDIAGLCHAYPILRNYHHLLCDKIHQKYDSLRQQFVKNGSVAPWLPLLHEPCYHRGHYAVLADALQPLLHTNPYLFRIAAHIGHSCEWQSLQSLLSHLESADPEVGGYALQIRSFLLP